MYKIAPSCQIPNLASIYEKVFGPNYIGTFVEVGAYDGETWSNTSGLADQSWKGIYIEPIPEYAQQCSLRHKDNNVTVIEVAVGNANYERIDIFRNGDITTADVEMAKLMGEMREDWKNPMIPVQVPQKTLDTILTEINLTSFDLLVIDTEGHEGQVLRGFDLKKVHPKMLIVELHKLSPMWQQYEHVRKETQEVEAMIYGAGYTLLYEDDINSIFTWE